MKKLFLLLVVSVCFFSIASCKKQTGTGTLSQNEAMLQKRIRKTIDDDEKRAKLSALQAESKLRQLDLALIFVEAGMQVRGQENLDQAAVDAILADIREKRAKTLTDVAALRLQMRALLTEDEWNALYEGPEQTIDDTAKEDK